MAVSLEHMLPAPLSDYLLGSPLGPHPPPLTLSWGSQPQLRLHGSRFPPDIAGTSVVLLWPHRVTTARRGKALRGGPVKEVKSPLT